MHTYKKAGLAAVIVLMTTGAAQASVVSLSNWSNGTPVSNSLLLAGNSDNAAFSSLQGPAFSGSEVFLRLDMTVAAGFTPKANDFVGLWLGNSATGAHTDVPNFGIKADLTGTSDVFARSTGTNGSVAAGSALTGGQSFTLLARVFKSVTTGNYDGIQLWFNPNASDTLATADVTTSGTSSLNSFSMLGIRTANLAAGETVSLKNLSVATSFAEVSPVPEPSTTAMLLAGLGMMGFIARRRS